MPALPSPHFARGPIPITAASTHSCAAASPSTLHNRSPLPTSRIYQPCVGSPFHLHKITTIPSSFPNIWCIARHKQWMVHSEQIFLDEHLFENLVIVANMTGPIV